MQPIFKFWSVIVHLSSLYCVYASWCLLLVLLLIVFPSAVFNYKHSVFALISAIISLYLFVCLLVYLFIYIFTIWEFIHSPVHFTLARTVADSEPESQKHWVRSRNTPWREHQSITEPIHSFFFHLYLLQSVASVLCTADTCIQNKKRERNREG